MNMRYSFVFVIILLLLFSFQTSYAQPVYVSNQYFDVGNPGGVNTEADAPGQGTWTTIIAGPQSANVWSPVQQIPFTFQFYGNVVTHYMVSQNGLVTFDTTTTQLPNDNQNLPTDSLPNNTIACYWDQFTPTPPTGSGDDVRINVFGTAPNRQLWIKWYSFEYGGLSFAYNAVVLEETSNAIYLVDLYSSTTPLLTGTAGIQMNNTTADQFGSDTLHLAGNGSSNTDNDYIEFVPFFTNDAGVAAIDTPAVPYCGASGLWVTIKNYGTATLTSASVNWSLNGVTQTPFAWTGSVPTGGTDGPVMISAMSFVVSDSIAAWTSMPNGVADENPLNDTLSTIVDAGLAGGTYTIGGVGADYATFNDAANDLNSLGICGPVVFDVDFASSPYIEQIELGEITGTSSSNTITFNGNGATLHYGSSDSDNRHVVRLNGADYVTFNDLTIEVDPDSTYGWGVHLLNAADHNTFNNVIVSGEITSTSSTSYNGIVASSSNTSATTAGNNANYLTIDSCTVIGGYYGIRLNGNAGGLDAVNNTISNSTIRDAYAYHIYLDDNDGALVSGNDISRAVRTNGTSFYGVFLTAGNINCTIEKNYIHNTHDSFTSLTGASYVIYFSGADAPVGQENVAKNNVIYNINSDGTIYAIYNSSSDGAHYYNNTISLDYTAATGGTTRGFYQTTLADNIDFRNNVLTVTRGGSGTKHGLYFATSTSSIISDNNAIYVNPDVTFGNFGGTDYATYTDWRTANGGAYDSLSVNADPLYANLANGDLTPTSGAINDIGAPLAEVTEDILGNPRPATPDPGAYEFTPSALDVGVSQFLNLPGSALPNTVVNFDIEITNYGMAVPADSLDFFLNGALHSSHGYVALDSAAKDTVSASFTTSASGTDAIVAALRMVPGDGNLANDTLAASVNVDSIYAAPYSQDFEGGAVPMGWTNETNDDFDWTPDAGGTTSSGTGPAVDHTLGTSAGYYMYTESSTPNYPFMTANLSTPYFDLSGMTNPAMEFWFHMYGAAMGELHFDVWSGGSWTNDVRSPLVGQYQTSDTSAWIRGGMDLTPYIGQTIKVRFRGITGSSFTSDMAIDDVRFDEYSNLTPFPDEIHAGKITMPLLTKMPLTQTGIVSAVNFEGSFDNLGLANTGDINVEVTNSSTVYSNSVTGVTIPGFQSQTFNFGPWDASMAPADQYNVNMYSSNFAGVNDTASAPLELGKTMGWDYGNHTNNIAYSSTIDNYIGTRFTLTDPDILTSITMLITSSTTATDSFAVDLYTSVNDTPGVAFARIFRGTFGDVGPLPALATFQIPGGMAMPAGDFYAICYNDTPSTGTFPIGADNTGIGSGNIPRRFAFKAGAADWIYFEDAGNAVFQTFIPIIRAGFQEVTGPTVAYSQSFEGTFLPAGWSKLNPDGGTGWNQQTNGTTPIPGWNGGTITVPTGGGNAVAFCTWNTGGGVSNDQYLVSPQLRNIQSGDFVDFWLRYWPDTYNDTLDVVLSTTDPSDPANFNILVDQVGFGAGSDTNWVMYSYDLSSFVGVGSNVYVGLREHVQDNLNNGASFSLDLFSTSAVADTGQVGAPGAKLLITEIVVTPTAGEFVEIHNPNSDPVDLSNFYLTDATFAGDGTYYYKVVEGGGGGGGFGDFDARFPDGATIAAGEYQTVALNGDSAFYATYGVMPTYELYDDGHSNPSDAPDMREAVPGSINNQGGLTNSDEVVILFYWDGLTDLVQDVDYLLYNSGSPTPNDEAVDKTGVRIDGPDTGTDSSMYLPDTPTANQMSAPNHNAGFSVQRIDLTEGAQTMTGGNGINGADETSEDMNNTFIDTLPPTPNAPAVPPVFSFFDDFESYTAGMQLAAQTSNWTTWSGSPGSGEDPFVSNAQAYSGSNSVVIVQNNDLVKTFGSQTSGRWSMSFQMYIPTGKSGYFNTLAVFNNPTFNWGMECYFDAGGGGRLFGGSATAVTFTWAENSWQPVQVIVDLDNDMAEFWFDGSMVHSWTWTAGASGGGSPLQLDANDFFGAASTDEMYFDDYDIHQAPVGIEGEQELQIPEQFALYQNYPNPFNPTTTIKYDLKQTVNVELKIYNVLGQLVRTLVNETQEAGHKTALWDGLNDAGNRVATGIYIYRIHAADFVKSRKMIMMK